MSIDLNRPAAPFDGQKPRYVGRHRWDKGGPTDKDGRRLARELVPAEFNPLRPADRVNLAPHHWSDPDRYLPAAECERTGRMDPAVVLEHARHTGPAGDRAQAFAEMRHQPGSPAAVDLTPWFASGCPSDDHTTLGVPV